MTVDGVGVKHWSRTQKARALSTGEAEYYAMVTSCAEGLGLQALAEDMGWKVTVRIWTDSSAAKAVAKRRGLGKLRHVELKWLWVQDMVKEGRVKLKTIRGEENVADHLTKPKTRADIEELLKTVGAEFRDYEADRGRRRAKVKKRKRADDEIKVLTPGMGRPQPEQGQPGGN